MIPTATAMQRREKNALKHLRRGGAMTLHRRDEAHVIARNESGFAWLSTIHSLERQRLVERRRAPVGVLFTLTGPGEVIADVHLAFDEAALVASNAVLFNIHRKPE